MGRLGRGEPPVVARGRVALVGPLVRGTDAAGVEARGMKARRGSGVLGANRSAICFLLGVREVTHASDVKRRDGCTDNCSKTLTRSCSNTPQSKGVCYRTVCRSVNVNDSCPRPRGESKNLDCNWCCRTVADGYTGEMQKVTGRVVHELGLGSARNGRISRSVVGPVLGRGHTEL